MSYLRRSSRCGSGRRAFSVAIRAGGCVSPPTRIPDNLLRYKRVIPGCGGTLFPDCQIPWHCASSSYDVREKWCSAVSNIRFLLARRSLAVTLDCKDSVLARKLDELAERLAKRLDDHDVAITAILSAIRELTNHCSMTRGSGGPAGSYVGRRPFRHNSASIAIPWFICSPRHRSSGRALFPVAASSRTRSTPSPYPPNASNHEILTPSKPSPSPSPWPARQSACPDTESFASAGLQSLPHEFRTPRR